MAPRQLLRKQIERSLLIEQVLKAEVEDKSAVTLAEVRAYYDKNPARFQRRRVIQHTKHFHSPSAKSQPGSSCRKP